MEPVSPASLPIAQQKKLRAIIQAQDEYTHTYNKLHQAYVDAARHELMPVLVPELSNDFHEPELVAAFLESVFISSEQHKLFNWLRAYSEKTGKQVEMVTARFNAILTASNNPAFDTIRENIVATFNLVQEKGKLLQAQCEEFTKAYPKVTAIELVDLIARVIYEDNVQMQESRRKGFPATRTAGMIVYNGGMTRNKKDPGEDAPSLTTNQRPALKIV